MFNLARALSDGTGSETDPVLAVLWMRRAAELGIAGAQAELATWYMAGERGPLPINYKESLRLSRLAADKGHAIAFASLGVHFQNGHGVPRDPDKVFRLYGQALALGYEPVKDDLRSFARTGHEPALAAVRELGLGPL